MVKKLATLFLIAVVTLFVTLQFQSQNRAVPTMQVDGGLPIPPWPGPSNSIQPLVIAPTPASLLADGGLPIPPWPPSGGVVG